MKRIFMYLYIIIVFSFINCLYINADCSYQERKDLLNAAKNVSVSFDVVEKEEDFVGINPNTEEEEVFKRKVYSFDLNVVGKLDNIFIKIYNLHNDEQLIIDSNNMVDGVYTYNIQNTSDIIKYYVEFYSENNNCFADNIYSKTIIKPKENQLYYYEICSNEKVSLSEYCKQFINKEFSKDIYALAKELTEEVELDNNIVVNNNDMHEFINNYWYFGVGAIVVIGGIVFVILYRKRKSRL